MKYSSLILFLLFNTLAVGQKSQSVALKWNNQWSVYYEAFEGATTFELAPGLPVYSGSIKNGVQLNSEIQFTNLTTVPATSYDKQRLREAGVTLSSVPLQTSGVASYKGQTSLRFQVLPFIKENGTIKRVTSFSTQLVASNSPQFRTSKTTATTFTQNSALAAGTWFKMSITETGMHKLTPGFLSELGVGENLPINAIRVVGNHTGILPERNSTDRPDDLLEVPVLIEDANNDGTFNGSDFIAFYAKGPHQWNFNTNDSLFRHTLNFYRDKNFLFVSADAGGGVRVQNAPNISAAANVSFNSYQDYAFFEEDELNLVATGRQWLGDVFDFTKSRNYSFSFTDVVQSQPANLRVNVLGRASTSNTSIEVSYNGVQILNNPISAYSTSQYAPIVTRTDRSTTFFPASPNGVNINLTYNNSANPTGVAYLDFIELQLTRSLVFRNQPLQFRNVDNISAGAVAEYTISNANTSINIWDVTNPNEPQAIAAQEQNGNAVFKAMHDEIKQFVAFSEGGLITPKGEGMVPNQNLHSLDGTNMLIVTHKNFMDASNQLADFHRTKDNMNVEVVDVEHVYNEFSSGGLDISAIRDFARMLYERSNAGGGNFRYLLLMGDASYDYRDRLTNNDNYVPIYESEASFSLESSSISDDYYALLDPSEGSSIFNGLLDIGVGRIPARFSSEANSYLDKIKAYAESPERFGDWRNKVLLIADDIDVPGNGANDSFEKTFWSGSESLARKTLRASGAFNVDKIYSDAYKQVSTTGQEAYPEASRDIFRKVQQGNLVTNYIGHGGEIGLSSEGLIDLDDVNGWTNIENMPLFITITCEFTRVDDPKRVSAGEQLLMNPRGGAISLISTTRVVGASPAITLNREIFDTIFSRVNNVPLTLGDIIQYAKNGTNSGDKAKFSLFGDPALRLAMPVYKVQTNTLNGVDINSPSLDTISAQKTVEISGQVNDLTGQKFSSFSGVLEVSVFDKPSDRNTLVNDGIGDPLPFELQNNLIYRGKVSVTNGDFTFKFIVPIDISYRFGNGKISYYASNGTTDGAGFNNDVIVGGFSNAEITDKVGPEVQLFMNNESFVRGGITGSSPDLYAVITDSSGINTVGNGVGHDLVAVLDGKTDQSFVLNEYYEADLDSYQSGKVRYPFFDLETGEHQLQLKVFDVFNNFSISETDFIVAEDEELVLRQVLNYPNPFTTYTEFQFEHNRANLPLEVQVQVFTVSGQLVKTINTAITPTGNRVTGIAWNGLDDYGDLIGKGVYVYRVKVNSPTDNTSAEEYEKLVILR